MSRKLVAYFSASGTTAKVAKRHTDKQESNEESSHCGGVPHYGTVLVGNSGNICPAGERQYRLQ